MLYAMSGPKRPVRNWRQRMAWPTGQGDREIGYFKMRYKLQKEDASKLIELPIVEAPGSALAEMAFEETRFSVAVAAFGELLRGSPYLKGYGFDDVIALAQSARGPDPYGYRAEFLNLVRLAKSARPSVPQSGRNAAPEFWAGHSCAAALFPDISTASAFRK